MEGNTFTDEDHVDRWLNNIFESIMHWFHLRSTRKVAKMIAFYFLKNKKNLRYEKGKSFSYNTIFSPAPLTSMVIPTLVEVIVTKLNR